MSILCIIILAIFLLAIYKYYQKPKRIEGLYTFNGRMAIDDQYYYDKLFDDVYYYANDEDGNATGWLKCKSECPGNCIEFGLTGDSYCFPY